MSRTIFRLCAQIGPGAIGSGLLLWAPLGRSSPQTGLASACALGAIAGAGLFAGLARRYQPPPLSRRPVARRLALAAPAVVLGAIEEEAVWRYAVFGVIQPELGSWATLALSSAGFALAHVRELNIQRLRTHLLTGVVFGGVYVGTGRISAAILAHVVYNLLVVAGVVGWQPLERAEAPS